MKTVISFGQVLALQSFFSLSLAQRLVSISSDIPDDGHNCLAQCIFYPGVYSDIGTALACGRPVENECYCATDRASASAASSWINKCASSRCSAGDLTRDISSIRSIYAGYCNNAGFTQPIISEWYTTAAEDPKTTDESTAEEGSRNTAEPSNTGDSTSPETTTRITLVTETAKTEPGSGGTRSRVTVEQTSTVYVNSEGSVIPDPSSRLGSSQKSKQLGIGIGVGVGVALILVALGVWFWMRKRKQKQFQSRAAAYGYGPNSHPAPPEPSHDPPTQTVSPISSPVSRIDRKAVPSPMSTPSPFQAEKTELSGQHVTREVSGTEIHMFSNVTPSPPVPVPGQHEMYAEGRTASFSQQAQSAPPYEIGRGNPRYEVGQGDPRYEVGQSDPRYELAGR